MKQSITKIILILLFIGLYWFGLSAVGQTFASFNDTETSSGNTYSAGTLDFRLTKQNASGFVGMEHDGEIFHASVAIPESGSMPMQYFVYSTSTSPVCSEFRVRVKQNETEIFYGPLPDFLSATTTVFGTWKFEFDLPVGAPVSQGDLCQANIIFSAWREEIASPEESGFFDIETLSLNLKAKTIVLNEVLAYPNSSHPYPANREFIELKNNGNAPVDVAGWKVSEMTDEGVENKYTITTAGGSYTASPYGGSTIIPAGGWLVLLLSRATALNNDGDTVRLYDSGDNKLDEYSYEAAKYGMSDARYLDGIGDWVDPIPTPGGMNILEREDGQGQAVLVVETAGQAPDIEIIEQPAPAEEETAVEIQEEQIAETETEPVEKPETDSDVISDKIAASTEEMIIEENSEEAAEPVPETDDSLFPEQELAIEPETAVIESEPNPVDPPAENSGE